eukprot:3544165-Pleurochrysis_carterae.AAC.1
MGPSNTAWKAEAQARLTLIQEYIIIVVAASRKRALNSEWCVRQTRLKPSRQGRSGSYLSTTKRAVLAGSGSGRHLKRAPFIHYEVA